MNDEPIEPLDPALATLLASEHDVPTPHRALERVWSRVTLGPTSAGAAHHAATRAHGWLGAHGAALAAIAFVAGGGAGAALHATLEKPVAPRVVYVDRAAPSVSTLIPQAEETPITPASSASTTVSASGPHAASTMSTLAAEHALLEHARSELIAGNAEGALALLDDYPRRFPKAQLAEEREALVIQSLVNAGRYEDARAAGARFKAQSPNSLFLPAVEASLGSIP